jgi:hypothetical protein
MLSNKDVVERVMLKFSLNALDEKINNFVENVTKVARQSNFSNPEYAYWMCNDFSVGVFKLGKDMGIPVELWSGKITFQHSIKEMSKGDIEGHTYLKIGSVFYDFTARQADPKAKFPLVGKEPLYPKSKKQNRLDASDEFWYEKLKDNFSEKPLP